MFIVWCLASSSSVLSEEPEYWSPARVPNYSAATLPAVEPVDLYSGPHLLIDDYLIAESRDLKRTTHSPSRFLDEPIMGYQQHTAQPFLTVLRDPQTQKFRMWYNYGIGKKAYIAYAESDDGIHWQTPSLGIYGPDNRILHISGSYGVNVIDEGPDYPNPDQRYKMAWWGRGEKQPDAINSGLYIAVSPDGIHWTRREDNPVLSNYFSDNPRVHLAASDVIDFFYDPIRHRYATLFKTPAIVADGYEKGPRAGDLYRRLVAMSVSDDAYHWRRPWRVIMPEARDPGLLEFYSAGGAIARGGLLIAFVRMLHDDYPVEPGGESDGVGYATLATCRDGVTWQRHEDIFFDRNPKPDTWDRAMSWIGSTLLVGDELYIYYGGYKLGHKKERERWRQLGVVKMPRDRFVSRDGVGETPGRFLTSPFKITPGDTFKLTLNAKINHGRIRVRVCDEYGRPLPGYDFADGAPVSGDGLSLPTCWKKGDNAVRQIVEPNVSVIRLDFELTDASLFAFEATQANHK